MPRVWGVEAQQIDRKSHPGNMSSRAGKYAALAFELRGEPAAVVIADGNVEPAGALGQRLTDAAHADDAEPAAGDIMAKRGDRAPRLPAAFPHHSIAPGGAAGSTQDQQHGDIGGSIGEHIGSIGDHQSPGAGRRQVDMVVAHGKRSDDSERSGQIGDDCCRELVAGRHQQAIAIARAGKRVRPAAKRGRRN